MSSRGFLGLGSNLDQPPARLRDARRLLECSGVRLEAVSSLYWTEPVEVLPQPWFLNQVTRVCFEGDPTELLEICQSIERELGRPARSASGVKGPRPIDLDVLLLRDAIIDTPELVIPHPRLHRRRFVLVPMVEIAPNVIHPLLRATMRELLERCPLEEAVLRLEAFTSSG